MLYIVQENVFNEENYDRIFRSLDKLTLEYRVISLTNDDINLEIDRKDIFVFGSVKMARLSTKYNWFPGSFYGYNHDYEVYSKFYKDNLLNYDCDIQDVYDNIDWSYNEMKFIRPSKDSKLFNGQLFTKVKWEDTIDILKERKGNLYNENIQINKPKKIYKEARCWVVGGEIITSSYYKFGNNVAYSESLEEEGLVFVKEMISIYQVADAFVMDVCLTPDGWKIVEINCINCSGFYKADLQRLLIALEDLYNPINTY